MGKDALTSMTTCLFDCLIDGVGVCERVPLVGENFRNFPVSE
jgi:hypothetical protein